MKNPNRVGGEIFVKVDGVQHAAKGNWTFNHGAEKRETVVGADGVHGYSGMPQAPFIEGAITDRPDLDLAKFLGLDGVTVTLELANGKTKVLRDAWYAGEGNATTEQGEIEVRFEGLSLEDA